MIKGIEVRGLKEFKRDLRRAQQALPTKLENAVLEAGEDLAGLAGIHAPRRSGRLAGSYQARTRATTQSVTGYLTSTVPYGAGAEWGRHARWRGFSRYGSAGARFAGRAIEEQADELVLQVYEGIRDLVEVPQGTIPRSRGGRGRGGRKKGGKGPTTRGTWFREVGSGSRRSGSRGR